MTQIKTKSDLSGSELHSDRVSSKALRNLDANQGSTDCSGDQDSAEYTIGRNICNLCEVNISTQELAELKEVYSVDGKKSDIYLKPHSFLSYNSKAKTYSLDITVRAKPKFDLDPENALSYLSVGGTILIFMNFIDDSDTPYERMFSFNLEFKTQIASKLKGKEIILITIFGDPEEGSAAKIIVDDEDEI